MERHELVSRLIDLRNDPSRIPAAAEAYDRGGDADELFALLFPDLARAFATRRLLEDEVFANKPRLTA